MLADFVRPEYTGVQYSARTKKTLVQYLPLEPGPAPAPNREADHLFDARAAGSPEAVRARFYPGDDFGHQFVYPEDRAV